MDTSFTDNGSFVMRADNLLSDDSYFRNCTFNNNEMTDIGIFEDLKRFWTPGSFLVEDNGLTFYDCDMGNSTYSNPDDLTLIDTGAANGAGSIFGEGSLAMIVALLALAASAVSICMTVACNKKKTAPAAAKKAAESEEEE